MNWQKDKLTIIGFGIIFVILGVFGYILWDMNREPLAEVVMEPTPITTKIEPKVEAVTESTPISPKIESKVVEKEEKSKVKIYTEQVQVDESGDNWDIKILRTINDSNPELLTTIKIRGLYGGDYLPYSITPSSDKKNLLIQYYSSGVIKLQLLDITTKEIQDISFIKEEQGGIGGGIFSFDGKQVFFLKSSGQGKNEQLTYDFNIFNISDKKNTIIKTIKTSSLVLDPIWLPDNKILLTYSVNTNKEKPEYKFYTINLTDKKIIPFGHNKLINDSRYSSLFNSDNTLFTKPKTFTTKEFENCYGVKREAPSSLGIVETISGKEIALFKGDPEEPVLPIQFSPDNKEILYRLGCNITTDNTKYYLRSIYDDKPRQEVNLNDIIREWDIIFNDYSFDTGRKYDFNTEIIFYQ